ncbi:Aph-1 domain containing protein [Nitzschia inconspicua]|uniref:Aph-1 domain containing protein n=1 Tax=Nitzschia inconspicua TaxID=303405 RepID=A0A9K3Q565_9STRA|nr:Aph-1 domain containing protein [Nitzschia inconspicua]
MTFGSNFDTAATVWGSAAIGFAPFLCFFFQIVFPKSQLLIISTTSAFFFLLAASFASLFWYILNPVIGLGGPWSALIPGIFFQFIFRAAFVALYHKVESVIELSFEKTEEEQQQAISGGDDPNPAEHTDLQAAKNKLSLNDAACGLAAGTGFGGLHALLLFGSLLASETSDVGILYQPSCPKVPALLVSALNTFCFFFLDIFWMLFTFFGMRRRLIFPRGGGSLADINPLSRPFGHYFGNTRSGGNQALITVLLTHAMAAGFTTFNVFQYGCVFSLTTLPALTLATAYIFWSAVSKIYMPLPHSNVRLSLPASFSYGGGTTPTAAGGIHPLSSTTPERPPPEGPDLVEQFRNNDD